MEAANFLNRKTIIFDYDDSLNGFHFATTISDALSVAEQESIQLQHELSERESDLERLTPNCDKTDYILAAASGVLCGIMDIFLVGKPGESPIGELTDKWFENRTKDFAKLCGWTNAENGDLSSAIRFLEKKFKIPYDQTGMGEAALRVFDITAKNHHFKSLGHNPTLLGLFFSILDQFNTTSHFAHDGMLITHEDPRGGFELRGNTIPGKMFCGIANWFGHLISDISGSSGSNGRGMGIPSPLWCWVNDIAAIKSKLRIAPSEFDKNLNDLAINIFEKGFDVRFQTAQAIPVFVNELTVRFLYAVRRMVRYYMTTEKEQRSFALLWRSCEPFSNASVKRMLTVSHGTFCLVDAGDALIRGFASAGGMTFNVEECLLRLNIAGIGRFAISLFGEAKLSYAREKVREELFLLNRQKHIIDDYLAELKQLSAFYDDKDLLSFAHDFENSTLYRQAFEKTVALARKRGVSEGDLLKNKTNIDAYFSGGNK